MKLIKCSDCDNEILERLGTICPNCGYTVGYFNHNDKRKKYGKFFALNVFLPFISFITILVTSFNKFTIFFGILVFTFTAYKSFPYFFKELFVTTFEKVLFGLIWTLVNAMLFSMIYNVIYKFYIG